MFAFARSGHIIRICVYYSVYIMIHLMQHYNDMYVLYEKLQVHCLFIVHTILQEHIQNALNRFFSPMVSLHSMKISSLWFSEMGKTKLWSICSILNAIYYYFHCNHLLGIAFTHHQWYINIGQGNIRTIYKLYLYCVHRYRSMY